MDGNASASGWWGILLRACRYFQFLFSVADGARQRQQQRVAGDDDRRLHRPRDGDFSVRPLPLLPAAAAARARADARPPAPPRLAVPLHALAAAPLQVRRPAPCPPWPRRPPADTTAPQRIHQARPRHRRQPHVTNRVRYSRLERLHQCHYARHHVTTACNGHGTTVKLVCIVIC